MEDAAADGGRAPGARIFSAHEVRQARQALDMAASLRGDRRAGHPVRGRA